jgi:hypothetical protein
MSDYKIKLLAKWFGMGDHRYLPEDDPQLAILQQMKIIAAKAYVDGGRWTEGQNAAAEAVIMFVVEMEEPK